MKSLEDMKGMNLNKVVKAIEADAGEALCIGFAAGRAGERGAVVREMLRIAPVKL